MAQGVRDLAIQLGVAFTIILLGYALRALKVAPGNHNALNATPSSSQLNR